MRGNMYLNKGFTTYAGAQPGGGNPGRPASMVGGASGGSGGRGGAFNDGDVEEEGEEEEEAREEREEWEEGGDYEGQGGAKCRPSDLYRRMHPTAMFSPGMLITYFSLCSVYVQSMFSVKFSRSH